MKDVLASSSAWFAFQLMYACYNLIFQQLKIVKPETVTARRKKWAADWSKAYLKLNFIKSRLFLLNMLACGMVEKTVYIQF